MGKNGGQPQDTILTLEEALIRFARKRVENAEAQAAAAQASASISKVHRDDFLRSLKRAEDVRIGREHPPGAAASDAPAAAYASRASSESLADVVALIDGVPRTLEDLERLAAADKAFSEDFPQSSSEPEFSEEETPELAMVPEFVRNTSKRDFALGAMGAALLVWVAILVTRVPIVNEPGIVAKAVPTPALKASSIKRALEPISTRVAIQASDAKVASARPLKPGKLEAAIKDTLKMRAFTDIGVSVSHKGDAYLAGGADETEESHRVSPFIAKALLFSLQSY